MFFINCKSFFMLVYLFPQRVNLFIRFKPAIKVFLHIISFYLLSDAFFSIIVLFYLKKFLVEHMKWRATGKISNQTNIKKKVKKLFPVVWIALLLVSVYRFLFKEMLRSVKRVNEKSYSKSWVCHFAIIISSRRLTSKPNLSRLLMYHISSNKCLHSSKHPPPHKQPSP